MKQFEYMEVSVSDNYPNIEALNGYGRDGWEICGMYPKESSGCASIYLKREILVMDEDLDRLLSKGL